MGLKARTERALYARIDRLRADRKELIEALEKLANASSMAILHCGDHVFRADGWLAVNEARAALERMKPC